MSGDNPGQPATAALPEDDVAAVYGAATPHEELIPRDDFKPWHHPVKQVVRSWQWVELTEKLMADRPAGDKILRYFTLPGPDLLDVRALAQSCSSADVRISYFGFDSGWEGELEQVEPGGWTTAESVLRQGGLITDDAVIHQDRLEDLAIDTSHAATQLRQQRPFDVVNIDACSHLAYHVEGRPSLFDALDALLAHQLAAQRSWLLFITTRADPDLLGPPGEAFAAAITANFEIPGANFRDALAECLELDSALLPAGLDQVWTNLTVPFLKLYCVGLGKYLLQYFHAQPNHPARVELVSCYAYRVAHTNPDMLALAFRINPRQAGAVAQPPSIGGPVEYPMLEAAHAEGIVRRAGRLWDLDQGIEDDDDAKDVAFNGTAALLQSAGYDPAKWRVWAEAHGRAHLSREHVGSEQPQ